MEGWTPPRAGGRGGYGCLIIKVVFHIVGFIISDNLTGKNVRRRLLRRLFSIHIAREDARARGTAKDTNIGRLAQWHGDTILGVIPDKDDLVAIIRRISTTMVFELLAVVLWRQ